MPSAFARFPPRLQEAIVSRLGWTSLRPVQDLAGHAILDGRNVVVLAPTAGGKTEASIFPALAHLLADEPTGVGALYLAPIKALLNNQDERLGGYTDMVGLRRFVWHGDISDSEKRRFMREPAQLLMTTPESLEVMLLSPRVPCNRLFGDLRLVIVDEVHALAGTDRGTHLLSVLERLVCFTPHDVQRIGLSATVGNPHDIVAWLQGSSRREGGVVDPPKTPSPKDLQVRLLPDEGSVAAEAARMAVNRKSLFFCQSRALAEHLAARMRSGQADVFVHHSSVSADERREAEARFTGARNACIVCTSTLELGIDVGDLDCVFQANAPSTVSAFLQRMGRTGRRAGQRANTTFFCDDPEAVLQAAAIIELARRHWVESVHPPRRAWPVLVHQLLALTLQFGAISRERCFEQLARVPDFSGVTHDELNEVVGYMLEHGYLFESGGLLSMGETAERVYGRKNFAELYAVFSSPVLYRVLTDAGSEIGALEQSFVDSLVPEVSAFLLGGRAWVAHVVHHDDKTVRVTPAPRGKKPSWGSFAPQLLGRELCLEMRAILTGTDVLPYLDAPARAALDEMRREMGPYLTSALHIEVDHRRLTWFNLWGGRINHTLKHGLLLEFGRDLQVVADNFGLRLEGDVPAASAVIEALGRMAELAYWHDEKRLTRLLDLLPPYRLSKFQRALPQRFQTEMVGEYLLDVVGAAEMLRGVRGG